MVKAGTMYDTVKFKIEGATVGNPLTVARYLKDVEEHNSERRGHWISGKLSGNGGDYTVTANSFGVFLNGSLAKYKLPSNAYTMTRRTTAEAVQELSDELHCDVGAAIVTRADFSTVFPTKRPPSDYYNGLLSLAHYKRLLTNTDTLYFRQNERTLVFYDKTKEAAAKGAKIPESLRGCNLLRYELRLLKHLQNRFRWDGAVTGAALSDERFYIQFMKMWEGEFYRIRKMNQNYNVMTNNIKTVVDGEKAFFSTLLQQMGQECVDRYLADLRAKQTYSDPKSYTRLKQRLYKLLQGAGAVDDDLIRELETAVKYCAAYQR